METSDAAPWTLRLPQEPPRASRDGDTPADTVISGPAEVLYLALWNRRPHGDGLVVEGDAELAELRRTASAVG